ncbi:protein Atp11p, mitochondrial [Monosporozyma servazzii]
MMLSGLRNANLTFCRRQIAYSLTCAYSTISTDVYKAKLLKKAKEQGFDTIDQLKAHLKKEIDKKKIEFNKNDPLKELDKIKKTNLGQNEIKVRPPLNKSPDKTPFKTLSSYMDVDKLKSLDPKQIEFLWRARWSTKDDSLVAVVPDSIFKRMHQIAKENPCFVLPLPRKLEGNKPGNGNQEGTELHYVQWNFPDENTTHCILTSLAEYKLHNQFARPHTVIEFHSELSNKVGVILMNGHVEKDCSVTLADSQLLLLNIQRFYGVMGIESSIAKERLNTLNKFNKGSKDFNLDKLIELAQSLEN